MKIPFFHSVEPILFDLSEHFVPGQIAVVRSNLQNLLSRIRKNKYVKNIKTPGIISETKRTTHLYLSKIHTLF